MWSFLWLFILEAVAITAANAATIVIFIRTDRLQRKQYIMIISQAVADFFVGFVSVPMYTALLAIPQLNHTSSVSIFRLVFDIQDIFFAAASLVGLAALAIERAHATYFPFKHSTLGYGPYIIGIVLMWILAPFLVGVPFMIFTDSNIVSIIITFGIGFLLVIISAAYFLIVLKVRCLTPTQANDVNIQENKRLTVTLAVVTILSLVTWLPSQFLMLAYSILPESSISLSIWICLRFLKYGNSLVNSVVYAFRMREIKIEILRVFQCCRGNEISINNESELRNT